MNDTDEEFGGIWAGASTLLVAVLCIGVFVFTGDPVNTDGVIAGIALALVGFAQLFSPRISPWFKRLNHRWSGLFWLLLGGGVVAFGIIASPTIGTFGGGLLIGALFVLYGCFVILGR
ncbi:hypothetical protein [Haloarcula sediminis]|uniref:hypothetical protein n=1 Tax=Haloarcula sediminis TaxID=3111777 RepID=UPI002D785EF4|nr:hypothetical protein [Haloarcula sp. CK38]